MTTRRRRSGPDLATEDAELIEDLSKTYEETRLKVLEEKEEFRSELSKIKFNGEVDYEIYIRMIARRRKNISREWPTRAGNSTSFTCGKGPSSKADLVIEF